MNILKTLVIICAVGLSACEKPAEPAKNDPPVEYPALKNGDTLLFAKIDEDHYSFFTVFGDSLVEHEFLSVQSTGTTHSLCGGFYDEENELYYETLEGWNLRVVDVKMKSVKFERLHHTGLASYLGIFKSDNVLYILTFDNSERIVRKFNPVNGDTLAGPYLTFSTYSYEATDIVVSKDNLAYKVGGDSLDVFDLNNSTRKSFVLPGYHSSLVKTNDNGYYSISKKDGLVKLDINPSGVQESTFPGYTGEASWDRMTYSSKYNRIVAGNYKGEIEVVDPSNGSTKTFKIHGNKVECIQAFN